MSHYDTPGKGFGVSPSQYCFDADGWKIETTPAASITMIKTRLRRCFDAGCWILPPEADKRCSILDAGCAMLDHGFLIFDSGTNTG
jgi:hypothetical protein